MVDCTYCKPYNNYHDICNMAYCVIIKNDYVKRKTLSSSFNVSVSIEEWNMMTGELFEMFECGLYVLE